MPEPLIVFSGVPELLTIFVTNVPDLLILFSAVPDPLAIFMSVVLKPPMILVTSVPRPLRIFSGVPEPPVFQGHMNEQWNNGVQTLGKIFFLNKYSNFSF